MAELVPGCNLDWALLAGIGKVESNHANSGRVNAIGDASPKILGPVLNGAPGMAAIRDTDGGRDWLDFAGLADGLLIDLRAGARSYVGASSFVIAKGTAIENAVTGDGNDTLIGNALKNALRGMRGDDRLDGGAGADLLHGGAGNDTADYARSSKGVRVDLASGRGIGGDAQGDILRGIENLTGSRFADRLSGDAFDNILNGGDGNDWLLGGSGADTFAFSSVTFGQDTIVDFQSGTDKIDLRALHLAAETVTAAPHALGTLVSTPYGSILLQGVASASITNQDILL
jgi:Ca2+-binding RTX toxin-like protein